MKNIVDVELTVYDQWFIYNGIRCRNSGATDTVVCFQTEDGIRGKLPYGTEVVLTRYIK